MPRWVIILVVALAVTAGVGAAYFFRMPPFRPTLTCFVSDAKVCDDTLVWVGGFDPGWALYPELPGRITAIEVRPAPETWKDSRDPGFQDAEWAALLYSDGYEPVLSACYYASGDEVACHTKETPFASPWS
jgi:hypothetical protein